LVGAVGGSLPGGGNLPGTPADPPFQRLPTIERFAMSDERFDPQRFKEIQTLRTQMTDDLLTFIRFDNHTIGYLVAWVGQNLELEQLEALVDEMDGMYSRDGRSILGRRGPKSDTL
jgi:hypothetical protein